MELLSIAEIASRLGRDTSTVRRWLERGLIEGRHVGRAWVVTEEAVAAAEEAGRVPPKLGRPFEEE